MWDYMVVAGNYSLEGADVIVENPKGRGTLQRILDHYGSEGFEVVSSHYDNLNREIVVMLKKPKGGAVTQAPSGMPASAQAEDDDLPPRRRAKPAEGGRRSKADLDRLYRDG